MTTIAEEKSKIENEIIALPSAVLDSRLKVVDLAELNSELLADHGSGLTEPYADMSDFYGKQRALLRGIAAIVDSYDFGTGWEDGSEFTMPTTTAFGYQVYDDAGDVVILDVDPSIYYLTKKKSNDVLSSVIEDIPAGIFPTHIPVLEQIITETDGVQLIFDIITANNIVPGTLEILHNSVAIGSDDGAGNITGTNLQNSTVDYNAKTIHLDYTSLAIDILIEIRFESYADVDRFDAEYAQVDFTYGADVPYGSGLLLKMLNIAPATISIKPKVISALLLRLKATHAVVGNLIVMVEGMELDPAWDPINDDPEDCTLLNHSEFEDMLGAFAPGINNDITKSADPNNLSTGQSPFANNIEKNPFFPATDGAWTSNDITTIGFVHTEDTDGDDNPDTPKWSIHADIKWKFGNISTNPLVAPIGDLTENNPDTYVPGVEKVKDYISVNPTVIPPDVGVPGSVQGDYYEIAGDTFIHQHTVGVGPGFEDTDNGVYPSYYNDVQAIKIAVDGLDHLITQSEGIATLGDTSNTIAGESAKQPIDTQFITDTATFNAALDTLVGIHVAFDPLTARPTYPTASMDTLVTAGGVYHPLSSTRLSDLSTIIGTPASGYSKILYDLCNILCHKSSGSFKRMLSDTNTIEDIYDLIDTKREDLARLP